MSLDVSKQTRPVSTCWTSSNTCSMSLLNMVFCILLLNTFFFKFIFACRTNERQRSEMEGDKVRPYLLDTKANLHQLKPAHFMCVGFLGLHPGLCIASLLFFFALSPMVNASCSAQQPCPSCT